MTTKTKLVLVIGTVVSYTLLMAVVAMLTGCAHIPSCEDPEIRSARHGVLLECRDDKLDNHFEICTVSTPGGDHDYRYRSCQ